MERHAQAADLVRSALISDSLVAFYQPKVRLDDGSLSGFEALARILSGEGSVIGPASFGATFEDHEIARRIGHRMLHRVTADIASWREAGLDPGSVSLNVGEADFADGMLAKRVLHRLDDLSLPPSCLTIEVTEAVFLGDATPRVREALADLDGAGVKIELDDFGTGYASLVHLRAFPISRLKIDQSFVQALDADKSSRAIVQAVINLGHTLALEVIAEGVETQSQADVLRNMGCDLGQGYLFGRPVTAQQARSALLNGSGVAGAALTRDEFEAASAIKLAGSLI